MFEANISEDPRADLSILVIGVGTAGCKITSSIEDEYVDKLFIHSSSEILYKYTEENEKYKSIQLIGRGVYFQESEIKRALIGCDILFVIAGLGGETGSLVAPYISKVAKKLGILCVALCSFPFKFEGRNKEYLSHQAYLALSSNTDSFICIDNDSFLDDNLKRRQVSGISDIFQDSNNHFNAAIKGLTNLIKRPGMMNIDFIDVKSIFGSMGLATLGYSVDYGKNRSETIVKNLLKSPGMSNYPLSKSRGCLVNITAGLDMRLEEFEIIGNAVKDIIGDDTTVVIGTCCDEVQEDGMIVTIIVTGLPELPIDKKINPNAFDVVKLSKSIQFEAHQASAGLSILSYFNNFLHQKYSGIEAKVNIQQDDSKVTLIVETASGEVEKVEKSLYEFGMVVVGKKMPEDVLFSKSHVEQLEMKLEFARLELKQNARFLAVYEEQNNDYKNRIITLEQRVDALQRVICDSLASSQKQQIIQLESGYKLPARLIELLNDNIQDELSSDTKKHIEEEVRNHINDSEKVGHFKDFVNNMVYGLASNSMYSFLTGIISTLPR